MLIEVIKNKIRLIIIVLTGFALLQTLSLYTLAGLPFFVMLVDALIYSLLYFLISIPLLNVLRFGKMNLLELSVRIINYTALAVVTLGLTIGMAFIVEYCLFNEVYRPVFAALIPVRIFSSALAYLLFILICNKTTAEQEIPEDRNERNSVEKIAESENTAKIERIAVKSGTKIHVVPITEIICLVADGDYVQVVTEKGKFLKEQTMKYFETHLPEKQFVRVHRSYIVNVEAISRIELYEKQSQQLMLKNGTKIKVSQAGYKLLREKLSL